MLFVLGKSKLSHNVQPLLSQSGKGGGASTASPFILPFYSPFLIVRQVEFFEPLGNNFDPRLNPVVWAGQRLAVNGAFKTPGLRNVELTGPYLHNGGKSTLKQVIDFYDRGADFAVENFADLAPAIKPLGLTENQKDNLVAFLLSLTDDRVKYRRAPFDHPSICVSNGHAQDATGKLIADATDALKAAGAPSNCLPAVGAAGSAVALTPFLGLSPYAR